jgi:two-component system, OmpR family, response regulator VicR
MSNQTSTMQKTIVVIEDDPGIQEMLHYILTGEGYKVICSDDGSLFDKMVEISPSLILLDLQLSGGTGGELCKQAKEDAATSRFPIVLVSANTKLADIANACGAESYLGKPFNIDDLLSVVKKFSL